MKKIMALLLVATFIVGCLAGCSSTEKTPSAPTTPPAATSESTDGAVSLTFAAPAIGTATYSAICLIGQMLQQNLPEGSVVDVQPTSPGGFGAPYMLKDGQADLTFVSPAPAKLAYEEGSLGFEPFQDYLALCGGFTESYFLMCVRDSFLKEYGYPTLEEIFEKKLPIKIGVGNVGSMDEWCLSIIFEYYGYDTYEEADWCEVTLGDGASLSAMIKDGAIDAYCDLTNISSATMNEIDLTGNVHFMELSDALIDYAVEEYSFWEGTVVEGSWKNQKAAFATMASGDSLYCSTNSLSEDAAYTITKTICENKDAIAASFDYFNFFNPEDGWKDEFTGVPLHEGARRYFVEMGYMPE